MEDVKQRGKSNILYDWILPIVIAFLIALGAKHFIVYKVYIPSASMVPTLNKDDRLIVTRIYNLKSIERGDILVFESEELDDTLIKRIIGLPGDKITINAGVVSVNGQQIQESYVKNPDDNYGEYQVPEGKYFFLGDNRAVSYDSSKWDNPFIDGKDIKAKARLKVYPFNDFGIIK